MREDELVKVTITIIQTPKSQPHKNKNGYKISRRDSISNTDDSRHSAGSMNTNL